MNLKEAPQRLPLERIPDVARAVRLHGRLGQAEVGGSACYGLYLAVGKR